MASEFILVVFVHFDLLLLLFYTESQYVTLGSLELTM